MRRIGNLWPELVSFENLYAAYLKARRGKRTQRAVARFEFLAERELAELQEELESHRYRPAPYRTFMIRDPKPRLISAAPFRDRVVHHALCNVLEPIFERTFIDDSYACRKGKGTHAAVRRYQQFACRNRYVLKCDVRKFFPSVDHQIPLERLARKIKDRDVLWLAELIIAHSNRQEDVAWFFPGDDLFTVAERRRGLPIGNQTSQFFANVMLDPLDHFIKERLGCRCYVRYVDDFVLLENDKERLAGWREEIERFLLGLRLWLHPGKRVISRTADGIRFLGYRVWPSHRLLPKSNVHRFRRRLRAMQRRFAAGMLGGREIRQRIMAWMGHARQADTWRLRNELFASTIFIGPAANRSCSSGGLLEQQCQERPLGESQQEHA
jgi:retron-type reverse transcriptase